MAKIENLSETSIRDLSDSERIQFILDMRLRRRQVKEARKKRAERKTVNKRPKKSPEEILKSMSDEEILKVMAIIRGDSNASS